MHYILCVLLVIFKFLLQRLAVELLWGRTWKMIHRAVNAGFIHKVENIFFLSFFQSVCQQYNSFHLSWVFGLSHLSQPRQSQNEQTLKYVLYHSLHAFKFRFFCFSHHRDDEQRWEVVLGGILVIPFANHTEKTCKTSLVRLLLSYTLKTKYNSMHWKAVCQIHRTSLDKSIL